jgi:hypothetical protein
MCQPFCFCLIEQKKSSWNTAIKAASTLHVRPIVRNLVSSNWSSRLDTNHEARTYGEATILLQASGYSYRMRMADHIRSFR